MILNLDGIPSTHPRGDGKVFFARDPQGAWRPDHGDLSFDIEEACLRVHDALAARIFGGLPNYHAVLPAVPDFLFTAGLNSESALTKVQFEALLVHLQGMPRLNELLYLYDCRKLVSGIQECTKETIHLQGEFYRALNLDELFYPPVAEPDGVRYLTSPVVTNIHAVLGFVFIRLYRLLDYTTKLAIEAEKLHTTFAVYPKLRSSNTLYSDRDKLAINGAAGSLFEKCDLLTEVDVYRHLIIHDGLVDDMPKAYKRVVAGQAVEKFILLPDRGAEGRLDKFKNRNLFYGGEDKINLRLPQLVSAFQQRQVTTLRLILKSLTE